ncbi:hypothetical protein MRB53_018660 [Persea americana]|uniref:Uncharacterized protein n=1 Tax=Persea americana TaxID=3435 RepID=A0ACC2M818_PERAE|nr:hypothetical protein MRB53_018660 [Persea americana]
MAVGRSLKPARYSNQNVRFPLMVTWRNRLEGVNHLTKLMRVRKQLNNLTSDEVTDFIDHIKRSCDRALRNQSTDLEKFISSLKGKLKKFSTAFGTTFE